MYYYTVYYFTCIFYTVVRQISMLFINNKDSVFCICVRACLMDLCTCVSHGFMCVHVSWTYVRACLMDLSTCMFHGFMYVHSWAYDSTISSLPRNRRCLLFNCRVHVTLRSSSKSTSNKTSGQRETLLTWPQNRPCGITRRQSANQNESNISNNMNSLIFKLSKTSLPSPIVLPWNDKLN